MTGVSGSDGAAGEVEAVAGDAPVTTDEDIAREAARSLESKASARKLWRTASKRLNMLMVALTTNPKDSVAADGT